MVDSVPRYKLSATLPGHTSDVKALKFPNKDTIASTSRDGTVRFWKFGDHEGSNSVKHWASKLLLSETPYVNSVGWLDDEDSRK